MRKRTRVLMDAALSEYFSQLGRKGGPKGGKARAQKLTAEQRRESARKAVQARWAKSKRKKRSTSR
jgi:hypothetical protein